MSSSVSDSKNKLDIGIGHQIGPYIVQELCGVGHYGRVYRACHVDDPNTVVALKVVSKAQSKSLEDSIEFRALKRFSASSSSTELGSDSSTSSSASESAAELPQSKFRPHPNICGLAPNAVNHQHIITDFDWWCNRDSHSQMLTPVPAIAIVMELCDHSDMFTLINTLVGAQSLLASSCAPSHSSPSSPSSSASATASALSNIDPSSISLPFDEHEARALLHQLADGLEAIHKAGVMHLDLKPENVMLTMSPEHGLLLKIADFGLCRILDDDDSDQSQAKSGLQHVKPFGYVRYAGSKEYMCPEMLNEMFKRVQTNDMSGFASDIFSLAIITFVCVFGVPPWENARPFDMHSPCPWWRAFVLENGKFWKWCSQRYPHVSSVRDLEFQQYFNRLSCFTPIKRVLLQGSSWNALTKDNTMQVVKGLPWFHHGAPQRSPNHDEISNSSGVSNSFEKLSMSESHSESTYTASSTASDSESKSSILTPHELYHRIRAKLALIERLKANQAQGRFKDNTDSRFVTKADGYQLTEAEVMAYPEFSESISGRLNLFVAMHPLRLLDRIRWALDERFELQHELQVLEHEISIHATPNFRGVDRVDLVFKRRAFDSSPVDADDDQDDDEDAHIVRLSISVYSQAQALASLKEADLDEKDQTVFVLTFSQLMGDSLVLAYLHRLLEAKLFGLPINFSFDSMRREREQEVCNNTQFAGADKSITSEEEEDGCDYSTYGQRISAPIESIIDDSVIPPPPKLRSI